MLEEDSKKNKKGKKEKQGKKTKKDKSQGDGTVAADLEPSKKSKGTGKAKEKSKTKRAEATSLEPNRDEAPASAPAGPGGDVSDDDGDVVTALPSFVDKDHQCRVFMKFRTEYGPRSCRSCIGLRRLASAR